MHSTNSFASDAMQTYETFESAAYLDAADVFTEELDMLEDLAEKAYANLETDPGLWGE
jgi:hypothetical protein